MTTLTLTDREAFFPENEIIVSKTDLVGRMTYVNQTFCRVAGYRESELLGQPHNIIRHPDMPRAVFKLLWDTIMAKKEIFAYVKNKTKDGGFYWVFAHVTPSLDKQNNIAAYHSNRRAPNRATIDKVIIPLYRATLAEEARHKNGKASLAAGVEFLTNQLAARGGSYDEFILTL